MSLLYPFILGITTKLYDDIVDLKLNVSDEIIHILQSVIILFFTLTAQNEFFFVFPCVIVCALNSGFDNSFWKSLLPVSILLMMISYPVGTRFILLKIIMALIVVLGFLLFAYLEDKMFPEEVSIEKIVFRSVLLFVDLFAILFLMVGNILVPEYSIKPLLITCILGLGLMIESIGMMIWSLE